MQTKYLKIQVKKLTEFNAELIQLIVRVIKKNFLRLITKYLVSQKNDFMT